MQDKGPESPNNEEDIGLTEKMIKLHLLCTLLETGQAGSAPVDIQRIVDTLENLKDLLIAEEILTEEYYNDQLPKLRALIGQDLTTENPQIVLLQNLFINYFEGTEFLEGQPSTLGNIAHMLLKDILLKNSPIMEQAAENKSAHLVSETKFQGEAKQKQLDDLNDTDEETRLDEEELKVIILDLERKILNLENDREHYSSQPHVYKMIEYEKYLLSVAIQKLNEINPNNAAQAESKNGVKSTNKFIPAALVEAVNQNKIIQAIGRAEAHFLKMEGTVMFNKNKIIAYCQHSLELEKPEPLVTAMIRVLPKKDFISAREIKSALSSARKMIIKPSNKQDFLRLAMKKMELEIEKLDNNQVLTKDDQIKWIEEKFQDRPKEKDVLIDIMNSVFDEKEKMQVKDFKAGLKNIAEDIPFYDFPESSPKQDPGMKGPK